MDFHSLTRRELQSLCKLNKIPANLTNVAMADALQSLDIVEGIEEVLNVSKSETADLVESMGKLEVSSPKAPTTRCRTSTRQKLKNTDAENLPPTAARTTRRGNKQVGGIEESKTDVLQTPCVSSTRRKAPETSSCRNVSSQLNECEEESVMKSRRKATAVKKEGALQKAYSTRRSTRLTEKKSSEPRVKKESETAVKIDSFSDVATKEELSDEVNVSLEEVSENLIEVPENTVESDTPKAGEVEDAFEKVDVMIEEVVNVEPTPESEEEKEVSCEVDNLKQESDETLDPCDVEVVEEKKFDQKLESNENLEVKLNLGEEKLDANDENLVMVPEEHSDIVLNDNSNHESEMSNVSSTKETAMILENNFTDADENAEDMEEVSENTVDETMDVIPTVDNISVMNEEVDVKADVDSEGNQFCVFSAQNPSILMEQPMKSKTPVSSFKKMGIVSDDKENIESGRKLQIVFVDEEKKMKKDQDENEKLKNLHEISMRQLRKQVKALTIKSINANEDATKEVKTRPALQALCENQLVGGEAKN